MRHPGALCLGGGTAAFLSRMFLRALWGSKGQTPILDISSGSSDPGPRGTSAYQPASSKDPAGWSGHRLPPPCVSALCSHHAPLPSSSELSPTAPHSSAPPAVHTPLTVLTETCLTAERTPRTLVPESHYLRRLLQPWVPPSLKVTWQQADNTATSGPPRHALPQAPHLPPQLLLASWLARVELDPASSPVLRCALVSGHLLPVPLPGGPPVQESHTASSLGTPSPASFNWHCPPSTPTPLPVPSEPPDQLVLPAAQVAFWTRHTHYRSAVPPTACLLGQRARPAGLGGLSHPFSPHLRQIG